MAEYLILCSATDSDMCKIGCLIRSMQVLINKTTFWVVDFKQEI